MSGEEASGDKTGGDEAIDDGAGVGATGSDVTGNDGTGVTTVTSDEGMGGGGDADVDKRLAAIRDALAADLGRALPPVNDWRPTRTAEVDIRIASDGAWFYQGTPIERTRMVRLFSTVLRVDEEADGTFATYLVTPQERLRITVDDAPFTAVALEVHGAPDAQALVFTTNVGDRVVADAEHPITVEYAHPEADPRPYVRVRDRLRALISRAVFLELAELVEERGEALGVVSRGVFMPLSPDVSSASASAPESPS